MKEFIFEKEASLTNEYCDYLIEFFEKNKEIQGAGELGIDGKKETNGNVVTDVKRTVDITIPNNSNESSEFFPIHNLLINELVETIKEYYTTLDPTSDVYRLHLIHKKLCVKGFLMTKYFMNEGFFKLHNDFFIDENRYRVFNFIWYLNDISEGGRTIFFDGSSIHPKKGKLVIFPSEWFFSHKGEMPLSSDKYIITGWVYNEK